LRRRLSAMATRAEVVEVAAEVGRVEVPLHRSIPLCDNAGCGVQCRPAFSWLCEFLGSIVT
jgi:hypothetical protein